MQSETALVARICHDLITPLNAINLGLESLEFSNDADIRESLRESTDKANTILKFTRELFSEKSEGFFYSAVNLEKTAAEYLKCYRIAFKFDLGGESIRESLGKMLFACITLKDCMPFGGGISCIIDSMMNTVSLKYTGRNISAVSCENEEATHRNIFKKYWFGLMEKNNFVWKNTDSGEGNISIYIGPKGE